MSSCSDKAINEIRGGAGASVVLLNNVKVKKHGLEERFSPLEHLELFSKLKYILSLRKDTI